jgi:hypothetical protein
MTLSLMNELNPAPVAAPQPTGVSKPKERGGRPTKYSPAVVRVICGAVADGTPFRFAAALGGISVGTFYEWQKQIPEFSAAIQRALARGVHERLKLVKAAAKKGDVRAAMWWLEHVLPEDFARNRIEHAGQVGVSVKPKPSEISIERLREAYKRRYGREFVNGLGEANSLSNNLSVTDKGKN